MQNPSTMDFLTITDYSVSDSKFTTALTTTHPITTYISSMPPDSIKAGTGLWSHRLGLGPLVGLMVGAILLTELAILIVLGLVSLSRKYRRRDLRGRETRNASNIICWMRR